MCTAQDIKFSEVTGFNILDGQNLEACNCTTVANSTDPACVTPLLWCLSGWQGFGYDYFGNERKLPSIQYTVRCRIVSVGKLVSLWSRQRTTLKKEVLSSSSTTIPCYIRQQLSRAILLWHLSAMDGNVESAMALGYRHYTRPRGRSTLYSDLVDDKMIAVKW